MIRTGSLVLRALLAVGLMFGFYALALAVALGLLYIPYAEVAYFHRVDIRLGLFCLAAAGIVLWSAIPRPDRFEVPGPELTPSSQSDLFRLVESVRTDTRQSPPKNVYLILDANAWVAERGGYMGVGSRRVMALGLPLMQVLTVDQLRAVLAHEFGHYYGGDTSLGPWIQKTRMGILRTIMSLGERWIRLPFILYAKLFFRITNAVSRQQEFAADALAARVVGAEALIEGLKQIHKAGAAFGTFWQSEFAPALRYQVRPPLAPGFAAFLQHKRIASGVETSLQEELAAAKTDPYDSHPPLPERCAALSNFQRDLNGGDSRPAIALLNNVPELERDLLGLVVSPELRKARPVAWPQVPGLVWLPNWRAEVSRQARALRGAVVADAASLCREPQTVARELVFRPGYLPDREQRYAEARRIIGIALAVAFVDAGWEMRGDLGDPITCTREGETIEPFDLVAKLQSGDLTPEAWGDFCERFSISALALSGAGGLQTAQSESDGIASPRAGQVSGRALPIQTCPTCGTRILPTSEGLCPSCHHPIPM